MEIENKLKHKKRRTRKNLDELRKRSRIMTKEDLNSKYDGKKKNGEVLKRNSHHITNDRLTLALFNKAVKSETVTRPIRTDRKSYSNNVIVDSKNIHKSIPTYLHLSEKLPNGNKKVCLGTEQQNARTHACQTNIEEHNTGSSSPDSIILFSPSNKNTFNINGSEQELATSHSYPSSDCDHSIYDEFMANISTHLIKNIPQLTKEGVIKKNIDYLQQTYLESCRQETESNILKCIKNDNIDNISPCNSRVAIIQNPMDYIQIGSAWQQHVRGKQNATDSGSSGAYLSQNDCSSLNLFKSESPEYIYFPHKLNQ